MSGKELSQTLADSGGRLLFRESFADDDEALEQLTLYLEDRSLESRAEKLGCTRLWKLELRATNGRRVNLDCQFVSEAWWRERRRLKGRHD